VNILRVDEKVLVWLNELLVGRSEVLDTVVKAISVYAIYIVLPIGLLYLWFKFKKEREATFLAFFSCIFSWFVITKAIVSNIWFRPRPNLGLVGGKELIFHRPDYSFPSDHATALFAVALGLYIFGFRRAGNWFLLFAVIICLARVAVGVHFPLDIVAGAASGLIGVIIVKILQKPILKYIYKPILRLMQVILLA
jgi:undecaprenyl-diphosphatase